MYNGTAVMENRMAFLKIPKIELPYDPAVLLLSVYSKEVRRIKYIYIYKIYIYFLHIDFIYL